MVRADIGKPLNLMQKFRELERKIEAVANARRGENTSIGEGGLRLYDSGGLTIDDGGEIHMRGGGSYRGDDGANIGLMHPGNEQAAVTAGTFVSSDGVRYGINVWTHEGEVLFGATSFGESKYVILGSFTDYLDSITAYADYIQLTTQGTVGEIRLASSGGVVSMPGLVSSAIAGVPVHIDASTGRLYQFTSSARYKQDITDAGDLAQGVLGLRPRRFRHRDDVAADPDSPAATGFIAEEVDEVLPDAVVKNTEGEAEGIRETAIVTGLVQLAQQQQKQLAVQQQQIDDLVRRVAALEGS